MTIGKVTHIQATRPLELAILGDIQRVSPREAEDGARAIGFFSERYKENLDHSLLARLNGRDRAAAAAVVAHRRRQRKEEPEARKEPAVFIPIGWLIADHTLLSHEQPAHELRDGRDTVEIASARELDFSLGDLGAGWLLAPGTLALAL
ncbi:MAG: hypothetical protein HY319_11335 [Armatimonadetes bacterium]|nr:hypothetical protein [Armatimonadota bacterium]